MESVKFIVKNAAYVKTISKAVSLNSDELQYTITHTGLQEEDTPLSTLYD